MQTSIDGTTRMCEACVAIPTHDITAMPHPALKSRGVPNRPAQNRWVIQYRCDTCGTSWQYVLEKGSEAAGFARSYA